MRLFGGKVDEESAQKDTEVDSKKQTAARLAAEMVELARQLSDKAEELIKEVEESREERTQPDA